MNKTEKSSFPRIDLSVPKIRHNVSVVSAICRRYGAELVAVSKMFAGTIHVLSAILSEQVDKIGDAHVQNIVSIGNAFSPKQLQLIRSPGLSQIDNVVEHVDVSFNSDARVLRALSDKGLALGVSHNIILMCEIGDNREGILWDDLGPMSKLAEELPGIHLLGIGGTLGCRTQTPPTAKNITTLLQFRDGIEAIVGRKLGVVSAGGSALLHLLASDLCPKGIMQVRVGEALALGTDGLGGIIGDTYQDACVIYAEVIEVRDVSTVVHGSQHVQHHALLAIGYQDIDPGNMTPSCADIHIVDSTSDHTIVSIKSSSARVQIGNILTFMPNYRGFVQVMSSPYVHKRVIY